MLTFRLLYSWLLVLVVYELTTPIESTQHNKLCYPVGNRTVCFFQPEVNLTWVQRLKAWRTCRSSNGTLPIILDEGIQRVFEQYMTSLKLDNLHDMWMAGREVRSNAWTWTNGQPFNEWQSYKQTPNFNNSHEVQGVLNGGLGYKKELPGNRNNYVCQFFGAACRANGSIPLKNGCLLFNSAEVLNFYDSRNKCVDRGGDLAIIDGPDDLNKFGEFFRWIRKDDAKLWIGLRRQWWSWGQSDGEVEVKYTNWKTGNGFMPDNECMVVEMEDYRWQQDNCNFYKRFVCQTGPAYVISPPVSKIAESQLTFVVVLVAGISIPLITILLVVLIVTVIVKKRPRQVIIESAPREISYQDLEQRFNDQGSLINNEQYASLQAPKKKPLLPPRDHPMKSQQTEPNPDYLYDDIAEIRAPHYLEVTY